MLWVRVYLLNEGYMKILVDVPITDFDCLSTTRSAASPEPTVPHIDYLSKDYLSFRTLILDRLSVLMPNWQEKHPADIGIAIAEILAYAADQLSYYQDAVATEAYLGTARQRISMRRLARLLDYNMHEGCNARVWVQLQVSSDLTLPKGTRLLTAIDGIPLVVPWNDTLATQAQVFETLYEVNLSNAFNELNFYTNDNNYYVLPMGSTSAQLQGHIEIDLLKGNVILVEEVLGPLTGIPYDADPLHKQALRIVSATHKKDSNNNLYTEISWQPEDALTFCLCINSVINNQVVNNISVARSNLVLADHGLSISEEPLVPETVPMQGVYNPTLKNQNLTFGVPFDSKTAMMQSANSILKQNPRAALPNIILYQVAIHNGIVNLQQSWIAQADLLSSNRFARDFVVEVENNNQVRLRFGDGTYGRLPPPGVSFVANYRIGNGAKGNIGGEAIAHVIANSTDFSPIVKIRNPLPAQGGIDPEQLESVRLYAPQAFQVQQRGVTEADYVAILEQNNLVQRAAVTFRWIGSWNTIIAAVEPIPSVSTDNAFQQLIQNYLSNFQLVGQDIEVIPPQYVPLAITLVVHIQPGYLVNLVNQSLLQQFSNQLLPNGQKGFFHPDNIGFGQAIYLSQIINAALQVPGVAWIDIRSPLTQFRRYYDAVSATQQNLARGYIPIDNLEIAQVTNDPKNPQAGEIQFIVEN